MGHLPKIILTAAQTSKNLFLRALMRQWYSGCFSSIVQFLLSASAASLLQFFLRAAMSHSTFDVGHDSTTSALLTASIQSSSAPLGNYFKEFRTDIMLAYLKSSFNMERHGCLMSGEFIICCGSIITY